MPVALHNVSKSSEICSPQTNVINSKYRCFTGTSAMLRYNIYDVLPVTSDKYDRLNIVQSVLH